MQADVRSFLVTVAKLFLHRPTQIFRAVRAALSCDELTGDFADTLDETSVGDCGSFGLFAGN